MTPGEIIGTLRARGARLEVSPDDRLTVSPRAVLDDALRAAIRARKTELVALLKTPAEPSVAADLLATYGTREDLAVQAWAEQHGHPDVLRVFGQLARRVDALAEGADGAAYHVAAERLVGYLQAIRAAYEAAMAPDAPEPVVAITPTWRLVVTSTKLHPPPIRLDAARSIVGDVAAHVEILLAKLAIAVEHRHAGRRGSFYAESVDEWLAELKLCGIDVSLEVVQ